MITEQAHEEANIIWGAAFDETMEDEMSVTVIATGFATHDGSQTVPASSAQKEAAPAQKAAPVNSAYAAPKESAPSLDSNPIVDDSDFVDIMSIFNKK